jgi:hypothetical protein
MSSMDDGGHVETDPPRRGWSRCADGTAGRSSRASRSKRRAHAPSFPAGLAEVLTATSRPRRRYVRAIDSSHAHRADGLEHSRSGTERESSGSRARAGRPGHMPEATVDKRRAQRGQVSPAVSVVTAPSGPHEDRPSPGRGRHPGPPVSRSPALQEGAEAQHARGAGSLELGHALAALRGRLGIRGRLHRARRRRSNAASGVFPAAAIVRIRRAIRVETLLHHAQRPFAVVGRRPGSSGAQGAREPRPRPLSSGITRTPATALQGARRSRTDWPGSGRGRIFQ